MWKANTWFATLMVGNINIINYSIVTSIRIPSDLKIIWEK